MPPPTAEHCTPFQMNETTITIDGLECYVQETTALEAWFVMHGLRRVLCGWTDDDPKEGRLAFVVEQPLEPKEIAFINEQASTGGMPPLEEFLSISGLVGVTDFRVVESTDLPGWDGSPNPAVLSNPRWLFDGKLVPAAPVVVAEEEPGGASSSPRRPPRSERRAARRASRRSRR